ncbi:major facilitator superfamily protein [Salinisphaera dokdonensis CL-ES53]|uniref:Major facilitator superfamily protein n=1 Tax=Salinisphaera dokdonensis CL-ES53 TaxID=1304272 RepID=A0ABV2B4T7_9GAMM
MFPILPVVGIDLGISAFMVGLILSANRITRLGFNPITGSLLDRFGARWPVAIGLVIEALGTLAFSIALVSEQPAAWFLAGRIIWGVGSSLLLVGALAAVMAIAPARTRAGMTAKVRTAVSLGLPAGLVLGGLVADQVSNNAAFLTATALSVVAAIAAVFLLPDQAGEPAGRAARADSATPRTQAWRELLAMPTLRIIFAANALLFFAVSGVLLATVAVLVDTRALYVFGMNAQGSAGLLMAVLMGARASTALACGRYLDHSDSRTRLLLPSMALVAIGFVGLGLAGDAVSASLALLVIGAGSGGLTIPMITLLGDVAPRHLHGRALSIYQWSSDLGGALGPAAGLELGRAFGYGWSYGLVGLAVLGMALPLRWLARDERRSG